ncbi:hypothetical protein ABZP36_009995 [Zizania latifolia]
MALDLLRSGGGRPTASPPPVVSRGFFSASPSSARGHGTSLCKGEADLLSYVTVIVGYQFHACLCDNYCRWISVLELYGQLHVWAL